MLYERASSTLDALTLVQRFICKLPHNHTQSTRFRAIFTVASYYQRFVKTPFELHYVEEDYRSIFPMPFRDTQFCSLTLNETHTEQVDAYIASYNNEPVTLLIMLGQEGYKISFTRVDRQNSWCVTLIPTDEAAYNKNKLLSSWSDNPVEALFLCGYKHYEMCDGKEWPTKPSGGRWG